MIMNSYFDVPVVLFTFVRLDTVKLIIEQLKIVSPSVIYIFSDGARCYKTGERENVSLVRNYINESIDWECEKHFIFYEQNIGCDANIRSGLDRVFSEQKRAIVFEDDAVPTQQFFSFCKVMLERYEKNSKVQYISGFNAIGDNNIIDGSYTFGKTVPMNGAFATWADRWNECDFDMKKWPENKNNGLLNDVFFFGELRRKYTEIYNLAYNKEITAWDYMFEHDMLTKDRMALVPLINLVTSYGYTEGAYHPQKAAETKRFKEIMSASTKKIILDDTLYPVVRNILYDKERQRKLLLLNGNYLYRHAHSIYIRIKDFFYDKLSDKQWARLRRIVTLGKR